MEGNFPKTPKLVNHRGCASARTVYVSPSRVLGPESRKEVEFSVWCFGVPVI
jgi:hypothetical protein